MSGEEESDVYHNFLLYHIHHGLTQEKFGSEEVRLAPRTPLPTILNKTNFVLFCPPKNCFVTPYTIFMVLGTPTRYSISYRFRGSPSLITPHLFPISNYASASPFWKSTVEVIASRTRSDQPTRRRSVDGICSSRPIQVLAHPPRVL